MSDTYQTGWVNDPQAVGVVVAAFAADGVDVHAAPVLQGFGAGRSALLFEAETKLFGKPRPPDYQARGTCTGRGTHTAIQLTIDNAVAAGRITSDAPEISYETLYRGGRVTIGNNSLRGSDGAVVGWLFRWLHQFGLLPRGTYGQYDFTKDQESWACTDRPVPQELIDASIPLEACFHATSVDLIRDCICAGYGVSMGSGTLWQHPYSSSANVRDARGMCRPLQSGGHCECMGGYWIDKWGDECFATKQSWGSGMPGGPRTIFLADGREIELPDGWYGRYREDVERAFTQGEAWVPGLPKKVWRAKEIADGM